MKDVSFLDKLKHTFHANLLSSTNSPTMTKYIKGQKDVDGHTIFRPDVSPAPWATSTRPTTLPCA